ncbi:hypothetical protein NliqN6_3333 [Naganishia liquefaciens]|uniref:Uncharacterized protein n=1 Tax=Naganishia liquefaciens TaxID=104408 RepID=A0A8H3TU15_9TREE|nr:hypothetical protein NliqN6_3333 [Naganishia liquefaciens]
MQPNSLASAYRGYPYVYNDSIYTGQPLCRTQHAQVHVPIASQGHAQRMRMDDSGLYAYAGGMPDTLPPNSLIQSSGAGLSPAAFSYAYPLGPNVQKGYASTIYPDPPASDTSVYPTQRDYDCMSHGSTLMEGCGRVGADIQSCCRETRHLRHTAAYLDDEKLQYARVYSESSSDDGENHAYHPTARRRRRTTGGKLLRSPPRRDRLKSSRSGQRTASRPPALPSVKQQSFDSIRPDDQYKPIPAARESDGRRKAICRSTPDRYSTTRSPIRYAYPDREPRNYEEDAGARVRPETLRLDALHITSHAQVHTSPVAEDAHVARFDGHHRHSDSRTHEALGSTSPRAYPEDPSLGRAEMDLRSRRPRSGDNDVLQRRLDRSESMSDYHFNNLLPEEFAEIYPLPSKRNSPSRLHRQGYGGNAPAGPMTRSKLHPDF